jgi:hypothetical protein
MAIRTLGPEFGVPPETMARPGVIRRRPRHLLVDDRDRRPYPLTAPIAG